MKIIIRPMKYSDLSQVMSINIKSLPENYKREHWDMWFHNGKKHSFVALLNGELCGYLLCDEKSIVSFAISEKYRNNKIGSNLLSNCLSTLTENVELHCREENKDAIRLYEKFGFVICETEIGYYQNPPDNGILMKWKFIKMNNNTKKMNIKS